MRFIVNMRDACTWKCSLCGGVVENPRYLYCPHCGEKITEPYGVREQSILWHPVCETLPKLYKKDRERFLITCRAVDGTVTTTYAWYDGQEWEFAPGSPGCLTKDVIAWSNRPVPYMTQKDFENMTKD